VRWHQRRWVAGFTGHVVLPACRESSIRLLRQHVTVDEKPNSDTPEFPNKALVWPGKGKKPGWLTALEAEGKTPLELP